MHHSLQRTVKYHHGFYTSCNRMRLRFHGQRTSIWWERSRAIHVSPSLNMVKTRGQIQKSTKKYLRAGNVTALLMSHSLMLTFIWSPTRNCLFAIQSKCSGWTITFVDSRYHLVWFHNARYFGEVRGMSSHRHNAWVILSYSTGMIRSCSNYKRIAMNEWVFVR